MRFSFRGARRSVAVSSIVLAAALCAAPAASADPGDPNLNFGGQGPDQGNGHITLGLFDGGPLGPLGSSAVEGAPMPYSSFYMVVGTWAPATPGIDHLYLRALDSLKRPNGGDEGTILDTGVRAQTGNIRNARVVLHRPDDPSRTDIYVASIRQDGTSVRLDLRHFNGYPLARDLGFGTSGVASVVIATSPSTVTVNDIEVAQDSTGRIYVGYTVDSGTSSSRARIRAFTAAGAPATAFGTNGMLLLSSGQSQLVGLAEQIRTPDANQLLAVTNTATGFTAGSWSMTGAFIGSASTPGESAVDVAAVPETEQPSPITGGFGVLAKRTSDGSSSLHVRAANRVGPANFAGQGRVPLATAGGARLNTVIVQPDNAFYLGGSTGQFANIRRVVYKPDATSAAAAEDTAWRDAGVQEEGCESAAGYQGIAKSIAGVVGQVRCPDSTVRLAEFFTRKTFDQVSVSIAGEVAPAGREVISAAALETVTTLAPEQPGAKTVDAIPIRGIPIRGIPIRGIPIRGIPLQNTPIRGIPIRGIPIRGIPIRGIPIRGIPIRGIPIRGIPIRGIPGVSWETLLAGTVFEGASLDDVTFGQVLDARIAAVEDLPFSALDLSETAAGNITLPSLLFAPIPLDRLQTPEGGWCALLAGQLEDCSELDPSTMTLLDLEIAGYDVSSYWFEPRDVTPQGVRANGLDAPIGLVLLRDLGFDQTSLSEIPATAVAAAIPACTGECLDRTLGEIRSEDPLSFGNATLGDLIRALPAAGGDTTGFPGDLVFPLVLAELIGGIIDPGYFALESAPLGTILDAADIRGSDLVDYTIDMVIDCSQAFGTTFELDIPPGSRVVPGSSRANQENSELTYRISDPEVSQGHVVFDVGQTGFCGGAGEERGGATTAVLRFQAEPGVTLGPEPTTIGVGKTSFATSDQLASTEPAVVNDANDPGDTALDAIELTDGDLRTGHLSDAGDIDTYSFPAPPAGTPITFSLSHLPADADLAVYGVDPSAAVTPAGRMDGALRASAEKRRPTMLADSGADLADQRIEPDAQQDSVFALRTAAGTLRAASVRRGVADERIELRSTEADQGGGFRVVVKGYRGSRDPRPYVVRATHGPAPAPLECLARPAAAGSAADAGQFPALPLASSTKTLILINRRRTAARFGATATADMMSALGAYAARPEVRGVIVPVESDPSSSVQSALAAWDAEPCSITAPQAAAKQITQTIDRVSAGLGELRHVVIVGSDDVMPQVRVPDSTTYSNEAKYADDASSAGKDTPVSSALRKGYFLTDDPYGDFDPETSKGGMRYVPDVGLGRLVESPADVVGQLSQYASSDGRLSLSTAYVSGYDFLKDGATAIADRLDAVGPGDVQRQINDTFDSAELRRSLNLDGADVTSVNAHFSHNAALSADAERNQKYNDIVEVGDVTPTAGKLLLTIGCHAGLNDPDSALGTGGSLDWVQKAAQSRAVMIANTGFGYGDSETVAYSEALAVELARHLATGAVTAGQAVLFAKQQFLGTLLERTDYDAKASEEHTFYGLPTYRVGAAGTEGPSAVPTTAAIRGTGPAVASGTTVTVASAAQRVDTEDGSYWTEPGHTPVSVADRPVQPVRRSDVTAPDGSRAHGVLVTGLVSRDITGVTPKVSRPVIDHSEQEEPRRPGDVVFPTSLTSLATVATPQGLRDRLTVATGQFIADPDAGGKGTQRLFDSVNARVLRSSSADFDPPELDDVTGVITAGVFAVRVTTPATDVTGGLVLYRDDVSSTWRSAALQRLASGDWGATAALTGGATRVRTYIVQLADGAGNVGTSSDKRSGGSADPVPAPGSQAPKVQLFGTQSGGIYTSAVEAALAAGEPADNVTVSIDGGAPKPYGGRLPVASTDGLHSVEVTSAATRAKRTTTLYFVIDRTAPTVTGTASRGPDVSHTETAGGTTTTRTFYTSPLRVDWTCADGGAGVATCPAPTTLSSEGWAVTATSGAATDRVGNTSTGTAGPFAIDLLPPTTRITTPSGPLVTPGLVEVGTLTTNRITLVAGDNVAGIRENPEVIFTPVLLGNTTRVRSVQTGCDGPERRSCSYAVSAGFPSLGVYDVRSSAVDRAGRTTVSAPVRITLVSATLP